MIELFQLAKRFVLRHIQNNNRATIAKGKLAVGLNIHSIFNRDWMNLPLCIQILTFPIKFLSFFSVLLSFGHMKRHNQNMNQHATAVSNAWTVCVCVYIYFSGLTLDYQEKDKKHHWAEATHVNRIHTHTQCTHFFCSSSALVVPFYLFIPFHV